MLRITRKDMIIAAIQAQLQAKPISVSSVSACEASCYGRQLGKPQLQECLDDCKAVEAAKMVYERIHKDLTMSFLDIVWGGGDIDPKPLEQAVRERFAQMGRNK